MNSQDLDDSVHTLRPNDPPVRASDLRDTMQMSRRPLWGSTVGLVEDLYCPATLGDTSTASFSPQFQVCLPYRGLFVWHVGEDEVVADANQVLFVLAGEPYRISHPVAGDYAELIITPDPEILAEVARVRATELPGHALFRRRSRRADFGLLGLRASFLNGAGCGHDGLGQEELLIELLRSALSADAPGNGPAPRTGRLIRRTKEFVQEQMSTSLRLRDVARAVGASPAYLTDLFRRVEGIPLHKYVMQLRLARALTELPHANDLTVLALELGFSSHSHFTAAFRRAFGCTPSQFRATRHVATPRLALTDLSGRRLTPVEVEQQP
jgi:AraC family transcriptional regulator